jgi:hypothetical protein
MISTTSAIAWVLLCCGLTALATSLFWYAALHEAETDAADLGDALLDEIAAHRATSAAHVKCCDDLRRHGINGAMRRHTSSHLRSVK